MDLNVLKSKLNGKILAGGATALLLMFWMFSGDGENVEMVKGGMLKDLDKSLTLGEAFDKYKYFSNVQWREIETENGRRVVEVNAEVDLDKMPLESLVDQSMADAGDTLMNGENSSDPFASLGHLMRAQQIASQDLPQARKNIQSKLKRVVMTYQFLINKDKTFEPSYAEVHYTLKDGKSKEQKLDVISLLDGLQNIYGESVPSALLPLLDFAAES